MRTRLKASMCLLGLVCTGLIGIGPTKAEASKCFIRDRNEFMAVVVCPVGLNQEDWREAGVEACGSRTACAAWIWDDPAKAPKAAPTTPAPTNKEDIISAVAIWVNGNKKLVTISPAR